MRHSANGREIAEIAIRFRDQGVAGFDIAGSDRLGHGVRIVDDIVVDNLPASVRRARRPARTSSSGCWPPTSATRACPWNCATT